MTNAEAIKIINQYDCNFYWTDGEKIPTEDLIEAFYLAVKALEEQEPRVLTLEETETCDDVVWMDKNIPEWEIMPVFVNETGRYLDTFITRSGWRFQEAKCRGYGNYGETWRCWSAKPSNEKREDTPWKD